MSGWLWLGLAACLALPGAGLVAVGLRAWLLPLPHRRFLGFRPLLEAGVRYRLGGYEQVHVEPDPSRPDQVSRTHRVAVIGGGIAGMAAATALAERGVSVTLLDANTYLGGKIGAWPVSFADGTETMVEHGFHAWFGQYYNFNRFLTRLGVFQRFERVSEYAILQADGSRSSFAGVEPAPALNLIDLTLRGVYNWRDIARDPTASRRMEALLRYDAETTYAEWDDVAFSTFAEKAQLSPELAVTFTSFTRAFFADPDRMSMAELIKSFHFYYLSTDRGLDFVYPVEDYHRSILEPWRAHMESHGVDIRLSSPVEAIQRRDGGYEIAGEWFDEVVLAAHLPGVQAILRASPDLQAEDPDLARRLGALTPGQPYAVLRVWLDKDLREGLPSFTVTHRRDILDSVTTYHRYEASSRAWVRDRGEGSVLELHCYSLPDDLTDQDAIRERLMADLFAFFPELDGAQVVREVMQVRGDFPAFHRGLARYRPTVETACPGLYLAGDWVRLPFPCMLMEAAYSSGVLAANGILEGLGARRHRLTRVPQKGLLAGVPGRSAAE